MTFWFNKKTNGIKTYHSKSISIFYYPQHWKIICWTTNGSKKGNPKDKVYDLNIWFLGIGFSYTDWDFN